MANQHWDRMDNEKQSVCHEHLEESCLEAELQTKLGFGRFKHPKPGAVPTIFNFDPT